jgi:hypothetical protein
MIVHRFIRWLTIIMKVKAFFYRMSHHYFFLLLKEFGRQSLKVEQIFGRLTIIMKVKHLFGNRNIFFPYLTSSVDIHES